MVVDTRLHALANTFGWTRTCGGIKGAKPYAPHGDKRTFPLRGWAKNTSAAADRISQRWRAALEGSDGDQCAMYNVTLNTLAGQAVDGMQVCMSLCCALTL